MRYVLVLIVSSVVFGGGGYWIGYSHGFRDTSAGFDRGLQTGLKAAVEEIEAGRMKVRLPISGSDTPR